jgi:hypothetical protein
MVILTIEKDEVKTTGGDNLRAQTDRMMTLSTLAADAPRTRATNLYT